MALSRQPAPGKNPRKLVTAKSIPGSSQAQCPFNATAGFLSMFHCQGISESCRRYKRVRQPGACSALPRVAEQDKREWGEHDESIALLIFLCGHRDGRRQNGVRLHLEFDRWPACSAGCLQG